MVDPVETHSSTTDFVYTVSQRFNYSFHTHIYLLIFLY